MSIRTTFRTFKAEAEIIGRLLAGYSELELSMAQCVTFAGTDIDTTFKTLFRCRGEAARIQVADALGRQKFNAIGLGKDFEDVIARMDHCRSIRNQYAHCTWWGHDHGQMAFANLEELAKKDEMVEDFSGLRRFVVDLPLLLDQDAYFDNVEEWWIWLHHECRKHIRGQPTPYASKPFSKKKPLLRLPG